MKRIIDSKPTINYYDYNAVENLMREKVEYVDLIFPA